jgi:hypothetical protein
MQESYCYAQFLNKEMGEAHTLTVECRIFYSRALYFWSKTLQCFNSRDEILLKVVILNSTANSAVIPTKHLCRFNQTE